MICKSRTCMLILLRTRSPNDDRNPTKFRSLLSFAKDGDLALNEKLSSSTMHNAWTLDSLAHTIEIDEKTRVYCTPRRLKLLSHMGVSFPNYAASRHRNPVRTTTPHSELEEKGPARAANPVIHDPAPTRNEMSFENRYQNIRGMSCPPITR